MKAHYLIVLIAIAQSIVCVEVDIPAPDVWSIVANIDDSATIYWKKVESKNVSDPIIGYKARRWELTPKNVTVHEFKDGVLTSTIRQEVPDLKPQNEKPEGMLTEIDVTADQNTVDFKEIRENVEYEFRVAAYTKNGEGPLSSGTRIKIG